MNHSIDSLNIIKLFDDYLETNGGDIMKIFSAVEYQGFDVMKFRSMIMTRLKESKLTINNLTTALIIFISRGNNMEKILNKTTDEGVAVFRETISALNLAFKAGTNLKPDDVTLSRLSAAFPDLMGRILASRPHDTDKHGIDIDHWYCFPQGASIIGEKDDELFSKWCDWAFLFHKKINPSDRSLTSATVRMKNFWNVSWKSPVVSQRNRLTLSIMIKKDLKKTNEVEEEVPPLSEEYTIRRTSMAQHYNITGEIRADLTKSGPNSPRLKLKTDTNTPSSITAAVNSFWNKAGGMGDKSYVNADLTPGYGTSARFLFSLCARLDAEYIAYVNDHIIFYDVKGDVLLLNNLPMALTKTGGQILRLQSPINLSDMCLYRPVNKSGNYLLEKFTIGSKIN